MPNPGLAICLQVETRLSIDIYACDSYFCFRGL